MMKNEKSLIFNIRFYLSVYCLRWETFVKPISIRSSKLCLKTIKRNNKFALSSKEVTSFILDTLRFYKRNYLLIGFVNLSVAERLQIGFRHRDGGVPHGFRYDSGVYLAMVGHCGPGVSGCITTECRLHSQALPEHCQTLVECPERRLVFPVCRFRAFLTL